MIDAGLAAARLTAVLRAAMRHGNKISPLSDCARSSSDSRFQPQFPSCLRFRPGVYRQRPCAAKNCAMASDAANASATG